MKNLYFSAILAAAVLTVFSGCDDSSSAKSDDSNNSSSCVEAAESSSDNVVSSSSSEEVLPAESSSSEEPVSSSSETFLFSWDGSVDSARVMTGLDNGDDESGYWWRYSDTDDGGKSSIYWPVECNNDGPCTLNPVVEFCKGICGHYMLGKGILTYDPFALVAFNVAGEGTASADASIWGGLCITYTVDIAATLELLIAADDNDYFMPGLNNPYVSLPAATEPVESCFTWEQFIQRDADSGASVAELTKKLKTVEFRIQGADGSEGEFNVKAIHSYAKK